MMSLCMLPGGLGRFVPCSIGANHCRLRMLVGRGVVMGLLLGLGRESASGAFLDQLLLHYPPRSSGALLAGTLPLRYCSTKFVRRIPFWTLPVPGHVATNPSTPSTCLEEVALFWVYSGVSAVDCKRRRCDQHDLEDSPVHPRTGVG